MDVRPAVMDGLESVILKNRLEVELEVAELEMLGFSMGVTEIDSLG